jgi:hypothetical protein
MEAMLMDGEWMVVVMVVMAKTVLVVVPETGTVVTVQL